MPRKPRVPRPGDPVVVDPLVGARASTPEPANEAAHEAAAEAAPVAAAEPVLPSQLTFPSTNTSTTGNYEVHWTTTPSSTAPASAPVRPEDDPQLARIKELENLLALERGKKDPEPEVVTARPGQEGNILLHFLEDGFTAWGQVWYRGQEVEIGRDSPAFRDTVDRRGFSWLSMLGDDFAQIERYGRVFFRPGPWPGKKYSDATTFESLEPISGNAAVAPSTEELTRAEAAEQKRRRAVRRLDVLV